MSSVPDTKPALPDATKDQVPSTESNLDKTDTKVPVADIEQLLAAKAKEDPLHVTKEDAARIESLEHKALGHRPPSGSVAAQVQATADKVENFHKVADHVEQKLREHPSTVTKEDAQQVLSKEHKVLGHYPPKDSISATAQRVASANERKAKDEAGKIEATKDDASKVNAPKDNTSEDKASKDNISKDNASKDDAPKNDTPKDKASKDDATKDKASKDDEAAETTSTRRMSAVDKAKIDQFKAKALDVVIREAKDAFQKELEEEFSKTGAQSVDKEVANKVMAEKTEAVESEKAKVEESTNGENKKVE